MPTVPLYPPCSVAQRNQPIDAAHNPLPHLLQTPSGFAILELQGTINLPSVPVTNDEQGEVESADAPAASAQYLTPIGRLVFPDYDSSKDPSDSAWQKRVHLYVGRHQRLTGEVRKLQKPLAVIQRRRSNDSENNNKNGTEGEAATAEDELEIVEIIKHKIIFSSRPEPFTNQFD
ncbi:hypothetical protein VTO42DRAFT_4994 [Malbranchea cinnamomea]